MACYEVPVQMAKGDKNNSELILGGELENTNDRSKEGRDVRRCTIGLIKRQSK